MACPRFVQCLLFIEHERKIMDSLGRFHLLPPRQRSEIVVSAVVPHTPLHDHICEIFATFGISVLTDSQLKPSLISAIQDQRLEAEEIVVEKKTTAGTEILSLYADKWRKLLVEVLFNGYVQKDLGLWCLSNRHNTEDIVLLDKDNLDVIQQLFSIRADFNIKLSYLPVQLNPTQREKVHRKYSGTTLCRMLEESNLKFVPKDAKDIELCFGAVCVDSPELIRDLLKWGAAVHYKYIADLTCPAVSGDILKDLLMEALQVISFDCFKFLLELVSSCSRETDFYILNTRLALAPKKLDAEEEAVNPFSQKNFKRWDYSRKRMFQEVVNSRGLNLNFILDPKFRNSPLWVESYKDPISSSIVHGSLELYQDPLEPIVIEHMAAVRALDLTVNESFYEKAKPLLADGKVPSLKILESPPSECLVTQVTAMKTETVGHSDFSYYNILNMSLSGVVRILRNTSVVQALESRSYQQQFPTYAPLIECRFRRAYCRRTLLDQSMKMFNFLFKDSPKLLEELTDNIFDYLTNVDLLVFVNICELPASESADGSFLQNCL